MAITIKRIMTPILTIARTSRRNLRSDSCRGVKGVVSFRLVGISDDTSEAAGFICMAGGRFVLLGGISPGARKFEFISFVSILISLSYSALILGSTTV